MKADDIVASFQTDNKGNDVGKAEYTNIINSGLAGQFEAKFEQTANGKYLVTLGATEGGGDLSKLSAEQKSFYDSFNDIANDHSSIVAQDVVLNDDTVDWGSYASNKIDVGDMSKFNSISDKGHTGSTAQGLLAHETDEQHQFTKVEGYQSMNKIQKMNTWDTSHEHAIGVENAVNGNERLKGRDINSGNSYTKFFKEANGSVTSETATSFTKNMQVTKMTIN
ncbi:hypothetical protein [Flavobacterium psychrotrophum]|uniref:hypothetical protein n=1 Tax=Flavobacterium psychrotrophum TaxID=2294119 RepID=UPI001F08FFCB|nr:hypothetical protein [Flavobacterium psychrotrophum]